MRDAEQSDHGEIGVERNHRQIGEVFGAHESRFAARGLPGLIDARKVQE